MPQVIHIPRRFDASYSLLGRWLRRGGDDRRAEALLILTLAGICLGLLFTFQILWWLLKPAQAGGQTLLYFWAGQAGLWLAFGAVCVLGFRPAIQITLTPEGLEAVQGPRRLKLRRRDVRQISIVSDLLFHRHYRRYAGTHVFVNRVEPELLLLHLDTGHAVLGLAPAGRETVARHLTEAIPHPAHAVPHG